MRKRPVVWSSKLAPLQMYWSVSLRLGAAWQVSGLDCTHSLLDVIPRHGWILLEMIRASREANWPLHPMRFA